MAILDPFKDDSKRSKESFLFIYFLVMGPGGYERALVLWGWLTWQENKKKNLLRETIDKALTRIEALAALAHLQSWQRWPMEDVKLTQNI